MPTGAMNVKMRKAAPTSRIEFISCTLPVGPRGLELLDFFELTAIFGSARNNKRDVLAGFRNQSECEWVRNLLRSRAIRTWDDFYNRSHNASVEVFDGSKRHRISGVGLCSGTRHKQCVFLKLDFGNRVDLLPS